MFITLLLVTFLISFIVSAIIVRMFAKPIDKILQRIIADDISQAWVKYLKICDLCGWDIEWCKDMVVREVYYSYAI